MSELPGVLFLTDLDDSLFRTLRKIPESERGDIALAARAAGGKDSYMTRKQSALLQWMDPAHCVPVTARGTEAYSRVMLGFQGPAAILANGAVLLDAAGSIDADWSLIVTGILSNLQSQILELPEIMKELALRRSMDVRSWAVTEPSCGAVYAVAKTNDSPEGNQLNELLEDIRNHFQTSNPHWTEQWRFHINGNNLSVTPARISKAIAVAYLLEQLSAERDIATVGVGDSVSDLEFMRICDVWITPTNSQIDRLLPEEPGTRASRTEAIDTHDSLQTS